MRVMLLNQTFYPDVAATAQHGYDLAEHLVAQGHEVVAIASRSIYGSKGASLPKFEQLNGIEIHRVGASYFGKSGGTLGRLIDFALWYVLSGWKALRVKRCDVCVAFTTPPFIALVGWVLRLVRGTKLVYWAMDLYPDVPVLYGMMRADALPTRLLESIHRFILKRADATIVLGRCMERRVLDKGAPAERVRLVRVWADRREVAPADPSMSAYRREWNLGDRFVVMYSGNFGMMHDAATILGAVERLRDREDITFVFVGSGARIEEARRFVQERGLTNARFEPYQPRERLGELLTSADVHLASMIAGAEGLIVPSKLFGILAAGRPVLFIGPAESEIARVIEEEGCGAVVPIGDVDALVSRLESLRRRRNEAEAMGRAGRTALEERYDRAVACAAIERVLREAAGESRAAPKAVASPPVAE